uniref:Cyclic nucleotide-binding domain-containing protein n=1 Tax=Anopheles atroparvus TaxID=41427 RepID=A0A182J6U3_ANOAO
MGTTPKLSVKMAMLLMLGYTVCLAVLLVATCLATGASAAKDGAAAERKLNIDPALRKALLRALRHLKERQEEEKQEQLLGDANTTEENFATTILDELLEESTVSEGQEEARVRGSDTPAIDYHTYVASNPREETDTIEGEVEQQESGPVTIGSEGANEIIKTIIIAKPKSTLSTPKLESENEIVPQAAALDGSTLALGPTAPPSTTTSPLPAAATTTTASPVPTTPAPTHNEDGENIEQVKSEDVKIFQAPLVAAFTVQQDQLGVSRNVIPLLQTPPKQQSSQPAPDDLPKGSAPAATTGPFIPSVSLPGGKPIPISVEQQLPFKEAVDFQPALLPQRPVPQTSTSVEQVKAISQPASPLPPQLARDQALPLKPFQPFNLFPVLPPLLVGPSPFDQQLPPLQQRNRVFRQEPSTGNFGLNQQPFRPSQPLAFASDSQNLQNLLFQSGITSRSAEDFNIITKVLALNHGIPQASSQRMFAKLSPEQQRQLLFRNQQRHVHRHTKLTSERGADLLDALARFSYFDRWSDEQRRDFCHRAQIRQFEPDQTVFVEGQAPVNYAHFVLSGECGLLQCLHLLPRCDRRTGATRYKLARSRPTEDEIARFHRRRQERAAGPSDAQSTHPIASDPCTNELIPSEYHFIDIATYSSGSVFGVGEHMVDRAVFARNRVHCLLIPRYWLLEKPQNRGNIWNRIRIFLEQRQPSRERLFRWFLTELMWHRYRRQLVGDFVTVHAPRHLPRLMDVPLVCRIEECDVKITS